jgi:alkylation response protein AidB-like acyl-CoA dehydrogenase
VFWLAKDLAGPAGMLQEQGPLGTSPDWWDTGFMFAPALTIGGGTSEILRNVIAERILGLPRDPDADTGKPWNETSRNQGRGRGNQ